MKFKVNQSQPRLVPLKSSENLWFSDDFRVKKSQLTYSNSSNDGREFLLQSLKCNDYYMCVKQQLLGFNKIWNTIQKVYEHNAFRPNQSDPIKSINVHST